MRTPFPTQPILACLCLMLFSVSAHSKTFYSAVDTSRFNDEIFMADRAVVYEPVCDANGKTYLNREVAKAEGATDLEKGHCTNYQPINCVHPNRLWISEVDVNDMSEKSGAEGYLNATNVIFELYKKGENIISLSRMPSGSAGVQQWKVWIDFDGDKLFEEDEIVVDAVAQDFAIPFLIPDNVEEGTLTRMRVFVGRRGTNLNKNTIPLGEVEDYTVEIIR